MDLDAVKAATWHLHVKAERSGVIADIIAGRASARAVAMLWRGLLPVYQALDSSVFGGAALAGAAAIEADLFVLAPGVDVPLLPQGVAYAERVRGAGEALVAHAYVRYLGDLNGGSILRRRLAGSLGETAFGLAFLDYSAIEDRAAFTRNYRAKLDREVRSRAFDPILHETLVAFEMTIALSDAARAAAT
jgi:heme oxygenase